MATDAFRLDGLRALVTGAGTGIGAALAFALAEAGADVACHGNRHPPAETAARISALSRRAVVIEGDLAQADTATALVDKTAAALGGIDILVNNAGIIDREDSVSVTRDAWNRVLDVNLTGLFFLCQHLGRPMAERGSGKVVSIASLLSFQGGIRVASYAASKHGVAGVTKALANEWGPLGVQVNAIAPGYIATDNTTALREDPDRSRSILERIPAGRWGVASDIAGAAVFLSSPAADYVNGHVLVVDGGWMAR